MDAHERRLSMQQCIWNIELNSWLKCSITRRCLCSLMKQVLIIAGDRSHMIVWVGVRGLWDLISCQESAQSAR